MENKRDASLAGQSGISEAPAGPNPATLFSRAVELHQRGQLGAAEHLYQQVIHLDPKHADAIHHLGVLAYQAGDFNDAVAIIGDALALNPRNAAALSNLGLALEQLGRWSEALASFERALAINAAYPEALFNRGNVLRELDRLDDALASYEHALRLRPGYVQAHVNRGRTLRDLGRLDESLEAYEEALRVQPGFAPAQLNEAIVRLALGDYARGLLLFEARWRDPQLSGAMRVFSAPFWDGNEPLSGATLLLHAEQGLGDTIQFCRYVPLLAAQGARIVLEVQPPLVSLLRRLDGVATVVARGDELPAVDFHCPLLSLPLVCGTRVDTIPGLHPYLAADEGRVAAWNERLGRRRHSPAGLRVGLVWSGNPDYRNDRTRSLRLENLRPLLGADADFISLQKDMRDGDMAAFPAHADRIRVYGEDLVDFDETAALTACVDLVIAVDTAGAHLAGALGKPLWLLLPFAPDWRWMLGRRDSPWYPSARLFRQARRGDWDGVIRDVRLALANATGAPVGA